MHAFLFVLAGLALAGAHLLRLPSRGNLFGACAAFLAGLCAAAVAIKVAASGFGIGRTTEFDAFVNHASEVAASTDAPLILFTGASFSRNAIDEERLTAALAARGYPHRVISLSLEAASIIERDRYLSAFLNQSQHAPDIVFMEIAEVTDHRPTFIFGNSKFSTRAIEQFDARGAAWTASGLAGGGCTGAVDCLRESGLLGVHALLNGLNIGLIGQGEVSARVPPAAAYDPAFKPRDPVDPETRSTDLASILPAEPRDGLPWATSFRRLQRDRLAAAGVRATAYYFPPVVAPAERAWVSGLCAGELAVFICISPDDPSLLAALDGDVWLDSRHLLDPAAEIYSVWLVDRIIASSLLEATR